MKIIFLITLLTFSCYLFASKERYSDERWKTWGSSAALILPMEDNQPEDSDFYGLILECNSKGLFRIAVKDIYASPNDIIEWETDKLMGTILNSASMVVRTDNKAISQNKLIIKALKTSMWIEFTNLTSKSYVKYTLKGFEKAINSTNCKV